MYKPIYKILKTLILFILLFVPQSSCELLEILNVNCNECYTEYPQYEELTASITINEENNRVPFTVYYGPYERDNVAFRDTVWDNKLYLWLETDVDYTIKVDYMKNGRPYYVIDGAKLKVRKDTENCDQPCYFATGKSIDLRIKF